MYIPTYKYSADGAMPNKTKQATDETEPNRAIISSLKHFWKSLIPINITTSERTDFAVSNTLILTGLKQKGEFIRKSSSKPVPSLANMTKANAERPIIYFQRSELVKSSLLM